MVFYKTTIEQHVPNDEWIQLDHNSYCFKLKCFFNASQIATGPSVRIHDLRTNTNYPQNGYFLPDKNFETCFMIDDSSGMNEIISNVYSSNDVFFDEGIEQNLYYYKIPWYNIPKNFLDFKPRHIMMMYNMEYLTSSSRNRSVVLDDDFYDKYYYGMSKSYEDLEINYTEFILNRFDMTEIVKENMLNF